MWVPRAAPGGSMFTLRILVAENNRPSLNLYRDILSKMGHEVEVATHGEVAWELFCQQPYHAVLIDYKLPGVDGEEFFQRVKKLAPGVDVVLLTGNSSIDKIMQLVDLGAADYLVKPVNPRRLREMFDRLAIKQKLLAEGSSMADELGELPTLDPEPHAAVLEPAPPAPTVPSPMAPLPPPMAVVPSGQDEVVRLRLLVASLEQRLVDAGFLESRNRELQGQVHDLETERERLVGAIRDGASSTADESTRQSLERELERSRARVSELESTVERHVEDLESLEDQINRRTRELDELEKSRQRMKEAMVRERDRASAKEAEVSGLAGTVDELNRRIAALAAAGEGGSSKLVDELAAQEAKVKDLERSREKLIETLERERTRADSGQAEAERLLSELEVLRGELGEARSGRSGSAVAAAELARWKAEADVRVTELEAELAARDATVSKLREDLASLTAAASARDEALAYLKRKHDARSEKFNALKEAAKVLEKELADAEALAASRAGEVEDLRSAVKTAERQSRLLKRDLEQRDQKVKELATEIADREAELLRTRTEALHSGEEVIRNTELRYKRQVDSLRSEIEVMKDVLEGKDEAVAEVETEAQRLREQLEAVRSESVRRVTALEAELADLRDVLSEREAVLREAQAKREQEYQSLLAQREAELASARSAGQEETERLEEELQELQKMQRQRELQAEYQSEWMELGEALVLLDEELKAKEAELTEARAEAAKKERAYETTIANQRRKYKELEDRQASLEAASVAAPQAPVPMPGLRAQLAGAPSAQVVINGDGLILRFNDVFRELLAIDDSRRPGQTFVEEVVAARQLRPILYRISEGTDDVIERPLYVRTPGMEPHPFWGVAVRQGDMGAEMYTIDLYDLSERSDLLVGADFADARIAFDGIDGVYRRALRVKESLTSVRIVFEILNKKFKDDVEIRSMVVDVLKELDAVIKVVEEI